MLTDLLIFSVLQAYRMVSHAQHCDDEVNQGEDAVQPQKIIPWRHTNEYNDDRSARFPLFP